MSVGFWSSFSSFSSLVACFHLSWPVTGPQWLHYVQLKLRFSLDVFGESASCVLTLSPLCPNSYLILLTRLWGRATLFLAFHVTNLTLGTFSNLAGIAEVVSDSPTSRPRQVGFPALTPTESSLLTMSATSLLRTRWSHSCFFWSSFYRFLLLPEYICYSKLWKDG